MVSEQRPDLPNRQTPFSEAFKKFIAADWAPYATTSPTVLPGAIAAAPVNMPPWPPIWPR